MQQTILPKAGRSEEAIGRRSKQGTAYAGFVVDCSSGSTAVTVN